MTEHIAASNQIIKEHTLISTGLGIVPVPLVDFFGVMAVQLEMTRRMCELYGKQYHAAEGRAALSALASTSITKLGSSLVKVIPVVGAVLGGVTSAVLSGASTYASGEVLKKHFEAGGSLLNLDANKFKDYYAQQFERGKTLVKEWKEKAEEPTPAAEKSQETTDESTTPTSDPADFFKSYSAPAGTAETIAKLQELGELKASGVISEVEFQQLKKKIIGEKG